jgi:hypothetical protein
VFLEWSFRGCGCGKALSFDDLFRKDPTISFDGCPTLAFFVKSRETEQRTQGWGSLPRVPTKERKGGPARPKTPLPDCPPGPNVAISAIHPSFAPLPQFLGSILLTGKILISTDFSISFLTLPQAEFMVQIAQQKAPEGVQSSKGLRAPQAAASKTTA